MKIEMEDTIKAAIWNATASAEEMTATHGAVGSTDDLGGEVSHDLIRRAARQVIIAWAAGYPTDSRLHTAEMSDKINALLP